MKPVRSWITLGLAAGSAFAVAWILARLTHPDQSRRVAAVVQDAAVRAARQNAVGPFAGVLLDTRLREALAMPDLAAAIGHIMAHGGEDHCADTRLICLIEKLPAERLAELPATLDAHRGDDYVVRFVLGAWAERDAAGALAWVQSTPSLNAAGTRAFLTGWMRAAPDAALAWLDTQPLSTNSDNLRTTAVEAVAETDPAAALELMKARGWIANSPAALVGLMRNWGGSDPQAALEGLRSVMKELGAALTRIGPSGDGSAENSSDAYSSLLSALLLGAYERDSGDAAELLKSLTPAEISAGHRELAQEVFARDPAAAAALFTADPSQETRALLMELVGVNPALAIRNLEQLSDPTLRSALLFRAIMSYREDIRIEVPLEARAVVGAALAGIGDQHKRHEAAARLAADNAASSPRWAATLWHRLPEDWQSRYGGAFFAGMVECDPAAAAAEFRRSPVDVQSFALKALTYTLAQRQPAAALQLVLEQANRAVQSESAATLFARWAQTDSASALAALEQHAAELDLAAIAEAMPTAGYLKVYAMYLYGAENHHVPTQPVADRLQQLLGHPPSDE